MSQSSHLPTILSVAYTANVPLLLWGPPGTGKTTMIQQFAQAMGVGCSTVMASIQEPADIGGYPIPSTAGVRKLPPQWALDLRGTEGILFVDELTTAPPSTQASALRVIHQAVIGDLDLGPGVRRWSAANPPEYAADGNTLAAPLANRFMHIQCPLDAAAWLRGAVNGWPAPSFVPAPPDWRTKLPAAMAAIAGYIQRDSTKLLAMPKDAAAQGGAWPSPRSWEMAGLVLAVCDAMKAPSDVAMLCVAGCVGEGAAIGFLAWRKSADLPDPEDLLRGVPWDVPSDGSKVYATLSSVVGAVVANPTLDRWNAGWDLLDHAAGRHADLAAMVAQGLAVVRKTHNFPAPSSMMRLAPMIKRIGGFGQGGR